MVQWINVFRNNSFVNPTRLPLLCRNSRAVALAEPDLMAGWLIDEMWVNFKFLKFIIDQIFILHAAFNKVTALYQSNRNAFQLVFSAKVCFKMVVGGVKIGEAVVFLIDPYY